MAARIAFFFLPSYSLYPRSVWVFIAYERMDGSLDGWMDAWVERWMGGWVGECCFYLIPISQLWKHGLLNQVRTRCPLPAETLTARPRLCPGGGGWAKVPPLPAQAVHTHYWLAPQSCLFQLAAPVTAHLVSPGGSMKWKFMFKFKNNILTLGASDVYIFNNLLRAKAWMSTCASSYLCVPRVWTCVLHGVHLCICVRGCR